MRSLSHLAKAQCIVLLTFDFDAESAQVRKTPDLPVPASKGQFGARVGIRRILELLDGHGIRATFFVPSWTAQRYEAETRDIIRHGHEVACHGHLHENLAELTGDEERKVLKKSLDIIRNVHGVTCSGFRAPYWEMSKRTLGYLEKLGFRYDSSLMNDDKPYPLYEEQKEHWDV